MFKISSLLCLTIAVASGALLFQTSQSVQRAEQDLAQVRQSAETEKESLRILSAEWDYLNRPERLEKLTLQNLDMDEKHAEKVTFIEGDNQVPEPRVPVMPTIKPSVKPDNLLRYVAVNAPKGQQERDDKSDVIENIERQEFNALVVTPESIESEDEAP